VIQREIEIKWNVEYAFKIWGIKVVSLLLVKLVGIINLSEMFRVYSANCTRT